MTKPKPVKLPPRKISFFMGPLLVLQGGLVVMGAHAQGSPLESTSGSGVTVVPRLSVTETFTNNGRLDSTNKRADVVSELAPGIRVSSLGGRIRGTVDYSLTEVLYANHTSGRQSQNSLNATANIDVLDNWAYLDLNGNIGQQVISAFGTPGSSGLLAGKNSTETSVFRLSPYIKGSLGSGARYEVRYSIQSSRTASSAVSDSNQREFLLKADSGNSGRGLSWSVDADRQTSDFNAGRATNATVLNAKVQFGLNEQWAPYARVGREENNYSVINGKASDFAALGIRWSPNSDLSASVDKDSRGFTGYGVNWMPSSRTSVVVSREGRVYGATHRITAGYRTPNTAWSFTDSHAAVSGTAQGQGIQSASVYDLLTSQFAAAESDPVRREQYDTFLQTNGIKPGATAIDGFLSSSVSFQRSQQLSFAIFGARSTLSVIGSRSSSTKLDSLSTAVDDYVTSTSVVQSGLSASYSYRLTGQSVISLAAARQITSGSTGALGTSLRSLNVNLSTKISRDTSASLGARRIVFDSSASPYTETAVVGNLLVQF